MQLSKGVNYLYSDRENQTLFKNEWVANNYNATRLFGVVAIFCCLSMLAYNYGRGGSDQARILAVFLQKMHTIGLGGSIAIVLLSSLPEGIIPTQHYQRWKVFIPFAWYLFILTWAAVHTASSPVPGRRSPLFIGLALFAAFAVHFPIRASVVTFFSCFSVYFALIYVGNHDITIRGPDLEVGVLFGALSFVLSRVTALGRLKNFEYRQLLKAQSLEIEAAKGIAEEKAKKIALLLDNMKQAVFSIDADDKVTEPVSKHCSEVFQREITSENIYNLMYTDIDRNSEEYGALKSALTSVFGSNPVQWEIIQDHFPKSIKINKGSQSLKISYTPIWNSLDTLEKILYIVEDVTDLEKLQELVDAEKVTQERNLKIVQEFLDREPSEIKDHLQSAKESLAEINRLFIDLRTRPNAHADLLRGVHTLKGNSRVFGFRMLSQTVNAVEHGIIMLCKTLQTENEIPPDLWASAAAELDCLELQFGEYRTMAQKMFRWDDSPDNANTTEVARCNLDRIRAVVAEVGKVIPEHPLYQTLCRATARIDEPDIQTKLQQLATMVFEVAAALGKEVDFQVHAPFATLKKSHLSILVGSLTHLLRNALDHGIEAPDERVAVSKPRRGTIRVECFDDDEGLSLRLSDDGKGIDPEGIAKAALEKNLITADKLAGMSAAEKIDLIFLPSFSTKELVTDVSGRGIGTDAARAYLTKISGTISVSSTLGLGSSFDISIPHS